MNLLSFDPLSAVISIIALIVFFVLATNVSAIKKRSQIRTIIKLKPSIKLPGIWTNTTKRMKHRYICS